MRTIVYVDGFNLYYGALKGTPYRWLDILAMAKKILSPKNQIVGMKYFTARVLPRPDNPGQPLRQEIYLRALRSLGADCIFGRYLSHPVMMRVADPNAAKPFVRVIKTEEKGSDVNIAAHMLLDAFRNEYDCAVLISGDSDLKAPVEMVRNDFSKTVGVINPQKVDCKVLRSAASFYKRIRTSDLAASQLPVILTDATGTIHKPANW